MGILKTLTVSHKREANGNYCVLLQKNPSVCQPSIVIEAGTIVGLSAEEGQQVRANGGFVKILDGYACLGMLQYAYECSREVLFLVIITDCVSIGKIVNSEIFCITDVAMLSMRNGPDDQQLILGVKKLLCSGSFYFSHSSMPNCKPIDITLAAQRAQMTDESDNRFFWNRLLYRPFERFGIDTSPWLVKAICGGVNIATVYIGGLQAKACLISRLSCELAGTRFNIRGVNDLGHVSNFIETEQVLFLNRTILSYLTIRGSIPLFWEQPDIQVGSHRIKMSRSSEISQAAYDKHMFLLKERFDNVVLVNLLSSRGSELELKQLFNSHHKLSRVGSEFPLVNFDYHDLCSRGHKRNLEKFYQTELDKYCDQFGYFHADGGQTLQQQHGVLRVNCLDCLDRTNSMQTFLGLKMLNKLVKSIDRIDIVKTLLRLIDVYAGLWAQNGEQISRIYTGTGSLEGKNLLKDGTLSVARTIQNNLLDGSKQSAIDILILGRTLGRDYSYRAASLLPHYYMCASPSILVSMCDRYLEYCSQEKIKVTIATWNVNGGKNLDNIKHNRAEPISDWLVDYRSSAEYGVKLTEEYEGPIDIYAIGLQEMVDINGGSNVSAQNQRDWLIEIQNTISRNDQYLLVTSVQLVGVCLFVFIRAELAPYIKDVCSDQVKTGLGDATGNKGAVAIRFRYKASSLCFVCAHFAAGQHQVKERNDDYCEITRRIKFPMGRSINSHDYVFWCGDFNYRLDKISNEEALRAATGGKFDLLLKYDQLKLSQALGRTFKGYIEGTINFPPTYKYDMKTNDYERGEKSPIAAYTDRVLFKKLIATHIGEEITDGSEIRFYNRIELTSSDHRPVVAEFGIEVLEVDQSARNQIFHSVLQECGPPDATVFVQVDGDMDVTYEQVFASILKLLADEAGEIVLVRYVGDSLMIIFNDGKAAVKALNLNNYPLSEYLPDNKLNISLRNHNWHQTIQDELTSNMDNTINLISGQSPRVHLEDDEDETAQELSLSIGPQVEQNIIFHQVYDQSSELKVEVCKNRGNEGIVSGHYDTQQHFVFEELNSDTTSDCPSTLPKSPFKPPSRLPPPPPKIYCDNEDINSNRYNKNPLFGSQNESLNSKLSDATFEKSSINLIELSNCSEYDVPPTRTPPELPLTPSKPPPSVSPQIYLAHMTRPTRAAPRPPVPLSRTINYNDPYVVNVMDENSESAEI